MFRIRIPCKYRFHRPMRKQSNNVYFFDKVAKKWIYIWRCDCEKLWLASSAWGKRLEKRRIHKPKPINKFPE